MTTSLSAAAIRMPHMASVAAPAPLAPGVRAESCGSSAMRRVNRGGVETGGTIVPAFGSRHIGTGRTNRFGGITRSDVGSGWYAQDQAQLAGGGPLRG